MNPITCPRCGGQMYPDQFKGQGEDGKEEIFDGVQCIQCGDIVDPVILANRKLSQSRRSQDDKKEKIVVGKCA